MQKLPDDLTYEKQEGMTDISICPICGKEMTVVGNTTKYYVCLECEKEREEVEKSIIQCFEAGRENDTVKLLISMILQREQEIRSEWRTIHAKTWNEDQIRADERKRVADILDDMWCLICNVSEGNWNKQSGEWQNAALRIREKYFAQLNEKKVER